MQKERSQKNIIDIVKFIVDKKNKNFKFSKLSEFDTLVLISSAYHNGKGYDLISLSNDLSIPRSSCYRFLYEWLDKKLVLRKKIGRRYVLVPTDLLDKKIALIGVAILENFK